jgi:hypothetical protein
VASFLIVGAWVERAPILTSIAGFWIVSDKVTQANVAVVLGGGLDVRPSAAAELYHKGLVTKIIVSQVENDAPVLIGAVTGHTELNRQILIHLNVPEKDIETFGVANRNTRDEARALLVWTDRHNASNFIVPTEIFSARRVRFIFQHELASKHIEVLALNPPQYTKYDWWKTDRGLIEFQNEILKYLYYRLKY